MNKIPANVLNVGKMSGCVKPPFVSVKKIIPLLTKPGIVHKKKKPTLTLTSAQSIITYTNTTKIYQQSEEAPSFTMAAM